MEEIFSVLFFVGMLFISVVAQKKKGAPKAAAPEVPSPDFFPPEENEADTLAPEVASAPFRPAAAPLRPAGEPSPARSRVSAPASPAPSSHAPAIASEPDAAPTAEAVRQGIIWSEILHRKYS